MSSLKKQTFFKFFLPEHSANQMKIPAAYWKHMKGKKSGDVYLKGPSGYYWRTKLVEENGSLYLAHGWPIFVKDHGIQRGHFFLFKFDGDTTFKVKVLSPTGCEDNAALRAKPSRDDGNSLHKPGKELVVRVKEEEDAQDRAEKGKLQARGPSTVNLPHFTVQLKGYNVSNSTISLGIPNSFVKIHLFHFVELKTRIVLRWHDKEWPATVTHSYQRSYIYRGWQDFVKESKVQEGDTCKFELVDRFVLRMHIVKHIKEE